MIPKPYHIDWSAWTELGGECRKATHFRPALAEQNTGALFAELWCLRKKRSTLTQIPSGRFVGTALTFMNSNTTEQRSPVRTNGLSMSNIRTVCRILPIWACAWYPLAIVDWWYSIRTDAVKRLTALGAASGAKRTIPFRTSFLRIRLSARAIDCPASPRATRTRFRSIDLTEVGTKLPSESGYRKCMSVIASVKSS